MLKMEDLMRLVREKAEDQGGEEWLKRILQQDAEGIPEISGPEEEEDTSRTPVWPAEAVVSDAGTSGVKRSLKRTRKQRRCYSPDVARRSSRSAARRSEPAQRTSGGSGTGAEVSGSPAATVLGKHGVSSSI